MGRVKGRTLKEGFLKFKFKEIISKERKEKIEKHPHAADCFRFRRAVNSDKFLWFSRINTINSSPNNKYNKAKNPLFHKDVHSPPKNK